jgi:hypothetical protein
LLFCAGSAAATSEKAQVSAHKRRVEKLIGLGMRES